MDLAELADRAAIMDVAVAYATALDTRDWRLLAEQFTPDATWAYPGMIEQVRGPEPIAAALGAALGGLEATQHLLGNHHIRLDGDRAEHTCYFQAQHVRRGDTYTVAGRYSDVLRRTPEGWKIASRELTGMWSQGNLGVFAP
ncbi:nuclear transport factor 2 family protein [Nonomuraea sediminis]|uniref:nuclear transport factor 2 family protein n=1 Tax=Nonomuraea sediminis TaxID=2835864 RepID=UPI001BDBE489|nr:nuclear transport factor 2 family protein [Nonomuraea sediminis]